jgi:hypothetical protein
MSPRLGSRAIFIALAGAIIVAVSASALIGRDRDTTTASGSEGLVAAAAPQADAQGGRTGEPGTTEPCHFPTTVPGGTLPQPVCEGADAIFDRGPPAEQITSTGPPFTCPTDDEYPIVIVSTSWSPATEAPSALPDCDGGEAAPTNGTILVPTSPLAGLDPELGVGVTLLRQPGGLAWVGTIAIPANRDRWLVELSTYTTTMPDGGGEVATAVETRCAENGSDPIVVRGASGCIIGDTAVWVEGSTRCWAPSPSS